MIWIKVIHSQIHPFRLNRKLITVYSGFGYVAQTTWLQRGTIRENIVWGADFDANRYQKVVESCALTEDISILGGDQKDIGESGQMLSGGQRARVALARAVYQDKESKCLFQKFMFFILNYLKKTNFSKCFNSIFIGRCIVSLGRSCGYTYCKSLFAWAIA